MEKGNEFKKLITFPALKAGFHQQIHHLISAFLTLKRAYFQRLFIANLLGLF